MTTFVQMYNELSKSANYLRHAGVQVSQIVTPYVKAPFEEEKFILMLTDNDKTYFIEEVNGSCILGIQGENTVWDIDNACDVIDFVKHNRQKKVKMVKFIRKAMDHLNNMMGE